MDETLFNSALWRDLYLTVRLSRTWASLSLLKFCVPAQGLNMIITLRSCLERPWISMFPSAPPRETLRFSGNKINCFLRDQPGCRVWKVHTSLFWNIGTLNVHELFWMLQCNLTKSNESTFFVLDVDWVFVRNWVLPSSVFLCYIWCKFNKLLK